jgi:radical SAM protein with 4Fe4S-binding SPASM domain
VMMKARKYIHAKKLPGNNQVGIGPCELHKKSYFGIDMNGKLYKCSSMVGREEFASGDIWEGENVQKVEERMGTGIRPWKDCGNCAFIPVCAGGCKAVGYDRYGDFTIGSCDFKYFKAMVQEMFERNLEETLAYKDGLLVENASLENASLENAPSNAQLPDLSDIPEPWMQPSTSAPISIPMY